MKTELGVWVSAAGRVGKNGQIRDRGHYPTELENGSPEAPCMADPAPPTKGNQIAPYYPAHYCMQLTQHPKDKRIFVYLNWKIRVSLI